MPERALYDGREITTGVPGKLVYLRATQAGLVRSLPGSTDLAADAHRLYYRFPWPDEDGTAPGAYQPADRALTLRIRAGLRTLHCRHENGVHYLRYQAWYGPGRWSRCCNAAGATATGAPSRWPGRSRSWMPSTPWPARQPATAAPKPRPASARSPAGSPPATPTPLPPARQETRGGPVTSTGMMTRAEGGAHDDCLPG